MPLTRKQAWRRVKVRQSELPTDISNGDDTVNNANAGLSFKRSAHDMQRAPNPNSHYRQQQQQQQQQRYPTPRRDPRGKIHPKHSTNDPAPMVGSPPDRSLSVLDKWRLPKEGRDPSARPGVTATRRQAAAACVRVGSRVSFNTVVAAILIPSAKDLHAAAREELWWQETDYRDFRINFIQFMRTPSCVDDLEMVPVDIVAESGPPSPPPGHGTLDGTCAGVSGGAAAAAAVLKPVVVGAVMLDVPAAALTAAAAAVTSTPLADPGVKEDDKDLCVRAWAVEPGEAGAGTASPEGAGFANDSERGLISAAAMMTKSDAAAATVISSSSADIGVGISAAGKGVVNIDQERVGDDTAGSSVDGDDGSDTEGCTTATTATTDAEDDEDKSGGVDDGDGTVSAISRTEACLSWDSSTTEEEDIDGNLIRSRRSMSNLETARRLGAGLDSEILSDDSGSDDMREEQRSSGGEGRPRALSLDGWFTCGLEQGQPLKSYDTHDHAGRLRDLVQLPPFPTVRGAIQVPETEAKRGSDDEAEDGDALAEAMQRIRVTFDVRVGGGTDGGKTEQSAKGSSDKNAGFGGMGMSGLAANGRVVSGIFPGIVPASTTRVELPTTSKASTTFSTRGVINPIGDNTEFVARSSRHLCVL